VRFDFTSRSGEKGYSHHTKEALRVYLDFPVNDKDAYERLMPYEVQMKIYNAYKMDFIMFGYPAPVRRATQLTSCPVLPFVQGMEDTQWEKEDLKAARAVASGAVATGAAATGAAATRVPRPPRRRNLV
jgi:hypothetical protein